MLATPSNNITAMIGTAVLWKFAKTGMQAAGLPWVGDTGQEVDSVEADMECAAVLVAEEGVLAVAGPMEVDSVVAEVAMVVPAPVMEQQAAVVVVVAATEVEELRPNKLRPIPSLISQPLEAIPARPSTSET